MVDFQVTEREMAIFFLNKCQIMLHSCQIHLLFD